MFNLKEIESVYMVGIGGIGMSALARYFLNLGLRVGGYDRTPTQLTSELAGEGCDIHFTEDINLISRFFRDPHHTMVIFTPAVPEEHKELDFFRKKGFYIKKRSEVLGLITANSKTAAVAGTHGKTTVSSMLAHILHHSGISCNAFVGGIMKNYGSNVLLASGEAMTVVEADEFDRSFLHLFPFVAVVTSCDPDHLDIYKDYESLTMAFNQFAVQVRTDGSLLLNKKVAGKISSKDSVKTYTYSMDGKADFFAENIRMEGKNQFFDLVFPDSRQQNLVLEIPGTVNIENAVAAAAAAWLLGTNPSAISRALATYRGVRRRFDIQLMTDDKVYIDDYAHHPEEIRAFIRSVREILPDKNLTGIFQPHLYSRTRDFADEFAISLSDLDELILLDIYPAREEPIPGVTSALILDKVKLRKKQLCRMDRLMNLLSKKQLEVLVTMGAGNIDQMVEPVKKFLTQKPTADA
jgi:UDP-N-acetylmuramate--alanine ligase